jgi:glycosyltransferase involved in cell wall biosynthesis
VDRTRDALMPYMHKIRYHYKENGGIASAKNTGISLSEAEFVAFLDHDDLWVHDTNASKNRFLFDNENLGVYKNIYDNFTDLDGEEKRILSKRIVLYSTRVAEGLYRQGKLKESKEYQKEALSYLPFYKRVTSKLFFKTLFIYCPIFL